MREIIAWLFAAVVLVAVVIFEILLWLGLAVLLTGGLLYEVVARLFRRPEKPIEPERGCMQCERERQFTNPQLDQYLKRRRE